MLATLAHIQNATYTCKHEFLIGGAKTNKHADGSADGAWSVCFDQKNILTAHESLTKRCVVYSFGVGNDFSFDETMGLRGVGCAVFSFDPTMALPVHVHQPGSVIFMPLALGASDGEIAEPTDRSVAWQNGRKDSSSAKTSPRTWRVRSLESLMRSLGHARINLLKIDVEGFEWAALLQMAVAGTLDRVDQLVFEAHFFASAPHIRPLGGARAFVRTLDALHAASFRLFKSVRNNNGPLVEYSGEEPTRCCWELSYVRTGPRTTRHGSTDAAYDWSGVGPTHLLRPRHHRPGRRGSNGTREVWRHYNPYAIQHPSRRTP